MARVVVAEDNAALLSLFTTVLSRAGHQVWACRDGVAALQQTRAATPVPFTRRDRKRNNLGHRNHFKMSAKSWRGDTAALISATNPHYIKNKRGESSV